MPTDDQMRIAWTQLETVTGKRLQGAKAIDLANSIRPADQFIRVTPTGRMYSSIKLQNILGDEAFVGRVNQDPILTVWRGSPLFASLRNKPTQISEIGTTISLASVSL